MRQTQSCNGKFPLLTQPTGWLLMVEYLPSVPSRVILKTCKLVIYLLCSGRVSSLDHRGSEFEPSPDHKRTL